MQLRPYQARVIDEADRHRRPLIVAPTGSGKTVIAARARFGHWPEQRSVEPLTPSPEARAWERHCRIRFAKRRGANG